MTKTNERWFDITINWSPNPGIDHKRRVGPYEDDDLDEYNQPPPKDVTGAVWDMIGDSVGLREVKE